MGEPITTSSASGERTSFMAAKRSARPLRWERAPAKRKRNGPSVLHDLEEVFSGGEPNGTITHFLERRICSGSESSTKELGQITISASSSSRVLRASFSSESRVPPSVGSHSG